MSMLRETTGRLTADKFLISGRAALYGVFIETDGSHDAKLIVYDNTSAAGKIMRQITVPGANFYGGWEFPYGLQAHLGIYCDITGAGAAYWVTYSSVQL